MNPLKKVLRRYNVLSVVAKATLWFIFCSILQKSISLITTPIFTRLMTTEQYGQFSIYNSWLQIFTIITTLRLNGAVFNKGMSKYKEERDTYTSTMQMITFTLTLIVFGIYLIFRKQFNELTELPTTIMVAIFAELLVSPAIDFWTVRKRYEYIYKPVVYRTLIMAILNAIIGVLAVLVSDKKGYARILTCVAINCAFGSVLFIYNMRKGKPIFKKEYASFAIKFNIPLLIHYFSQYILDQFDRIMVQKLVSIAAAGIYSVAYNIGLLLRIITTSINNALVPWQYDQLEKKEFKKLDDTMFFVFVIVAGCSFMLTCLAPEVMKILADEKYYEGVYVIPPVAIGLFFSFVYTIFANIEFFYGKNKFSMYISGAGALTNVVLNYIGIGLFGYIAAAYTTLICYILFAVGHYIYTLKCVESVTGEKAVFNTKRLSILSVAVILIGIIFIFIYDYSLIRYALVVLMSVIFGINRNKIKTMIFTIKKQS